MRVGDPAWAHRYGGAQPLPRRYAQQQGGLTGRAAIPRTYVAPHISNLSYSSMLVHFSCVWQWRHVQLHLRMYYMYSTYSPKNSAYECLVMKPAMPWTCQTLTESMSGKIHCRISLHAFSGAAAPASLSWSPRGFCCMQGQFMCTEYL